MTPDGFQDEDSSDHETWPPESVRGNPPDRPRPSWWDDLFRVPEGPATPCDVVAWWEARRLRYNLLVLTLGVPSFLLYLFFLIKSGQLAPGEDAVEPMGLLASPILVPVAVNVAYSFGRIVEFIWRAISRDQTRRSGRFLMRLGIGFSLFVILLIRDSPSHRYLGRNLVLQRRTQKVARRTPWSRPPQTRPQATANAAPDQTLLAPSLSL